MQSELNHISALNGTRDLAEEIAHLHRIGVDVLFSFSSGQDSKDSNAMIGQADQGGLGLPEKDYYFRDDEKANDTRKQYVEHMVRVLGMLGVAPAEARLRGPKPPCASRPSWPKSLSMSPRGEIPRRRTTR